MAGPGPLDVAAAEDAGSWPSTLRFSSTWMASYEGYEFENHNDATQKEEYNRGPGALLLDHPYTRETKGHSKARSSP